MGATFRPDCPVKFNAKLNWSFPMRGLTRYASSLMSRPNKTAMTMPSFINPDLPVCGESSDDRGHNEYYTRGQFLARQERWEDLSDLIAEKDKDREKTPAGVSMAALLSDGARADAVDAARQAIARGDGGLPSGIVSLDEIATELDEHWAVSVTAARAHMEFAWACVGQVDPYARPEKIPASFRHLFGLAADLLDHAADIVPDSAFVAAAQCDLLASDYKADEKVDKVHSRALSLDPENPGRLRAYGVHLLPRWFGTHARLSGSAARLTEEFADIWGEGAYTWVWFDALRLAPRAAALLDADRFLRGMNDILERHTDPHLANLMVAYLSGMEAQTAPGDLPQDARRARAALHRALPDMMDMHLTELHPQVWAREHALPGAAHPGPLSEGRIAAATAQARSALGHALARTA
jgi:hypothetical protein